MTNFVLILEESESEDESLTEISKTSSKKSLRGSLAVTVASMKFKNKKNSNASKRKLSNSFKRKDSYKIKDKSEKRSFLEENIKNAGNAEIHTRNKSILSNDEDALNTTNSSKESDELESSKKQSDIVEAEEKQHHKETITILYNKEKKDLEQAHKVLLQEYNKSNEKRNTREILECEICDTCFQSDLCDTSFESEKKLIDHLVSAHDKKCLLNCVICKTEFSDFSSLTSHAKSAHLNVKQRYTFLY